jgi:hypothetical protein
MFAVVSMFFIVSMNFHVAANSTKKEDDPRVSVFDVGSLSATSYSVETPSQAEKEEFPAGNPIHLLMINGSFVPKAQIVLTNGRTLVPIRLISETLGAEVGWEAASKKVTIKSTGVLIELTVNSKQAHVNNAIHTLDVPAQVYNDRTYVPLRFISEGLNAKVDYFEKFNGRTGSIKNTDIRVVTVEKTAASPKFSIENGLSQIQNESIKMHESILELMQEQAKNGASSGFSEARPDYDPKAIEYTNQILGRYYIYRLKAFGDYRILFNSHTGEIFSDKAGLPLLNIEPGFINLSWLYQ